MAKFGKKYNASAELIDKAKLYDVDEAVSLVCQTAKAKFDETVEIHIRLGVDSRHADQQVRGAIVLPNGTGKTVRTLVFARGDKAEAARAAGADYVGAVIKAKPAAAKGQYIKSCVIATTMGPGIKVNYAKLG